MTIDRALELAEAALHEKRLTAAGPKNTTARELEEALKIIGTLRNPNITIGRLFRRLST